MVTSIEQQYIDLHSESLAKVQVAKDLFPTASPRRPEPHPLPVYVPTRGANKTTLTQQDRRLQTGTRPDFSPQPSAVVKAVQDQMAKGTIGSASTDIEISGASS